MLGIPGADTWPSCVYICQTQSTHKNWIILLSDILHSHPHPQLACFIRLPSISQPCLVELILPDISASFYATDPPNTDTFDTNTFDTDTSSTATQTPSTQRLKRGGRPYSSLHSMGGKMLSGALHPACPPQCCRRSVLVLPPYRCHVFALYYRMVAQVPTAWLHNRCLLKQRADIKKARSGFTAIHKAAHHGHDEVLELLLNDQRFRGTNVDAFDVSEKNGTLAQSSDVTPLFLASRFGHIDAARMLIGHRADVNRWCPLNWTIILHCSTASLLHCFTFTAHCSIAAQLHCYTTGSLRSEAAARAMCPLRYGFFLIMCVCEWCAPPQRQRWMAIAAPRRSPWSPGAR